MASNTLPNSSPLSFAEILLGNLTRFETAFPQTLECPQTGKARLLMEQALSLLAQLNPPRLVMCDFCDEYCDCRDKGTVHLIESEETLCLRHFQQRLREL